MSYTKGCYTGQEVNHRIHTRGHTNKTWGVYVSESWLEPGTTLLSKEGENAGVVTRCEPLSERQWLVGAMVKNEQALTLASFQP